MKVTAFILAAGLGTRLYPLTADRPKALVRYHGEPLIKIVIDRIIASGVRNIVVNVHHFPDQIIDFLKNTHVDADVTISDERAYLRDTAGGLKFAEPLFGDADTILVHNVDILTDLDLRKMIACHEKLGADATLAVRERKTARYLVFNRDNMRLCGWHNVQSGAIAGEVFFDQAVELAFSGIHLVNRALVRQIKSVEKQSITPFYVDNSSVFNIQGFWHQNGEWMDVGKYSEYANILT